MVSPAWKALLRMPQKSSPAVRGNDSKTSNDTTTNLLHFIISSIYSFKTPHKQKPSLLFPENFDTQDQQAANKGRYYQVDQPNGERSRKNTNGIATVQLNNFYSGFPADTQVGKKGKRWKYGQHQEQYTYALQGLPPVN